MCSTRRVTRPATFAYCAGQFASGLYGAFNGFILSLYLSQFTSNAILIGWLSSTRSFEQSVTQPIVGSASDRIWTRFGRRAPFFLLAMPVVAVLMIFNGLLPIPPNPTEPAHLWLVVLTIFLFSLIFNIGIDPYYALLVDATTPDQRGRKSGWAQMAGETVFLSERGQVRARELERNYRLWEHFLTEEVNLPVDHTQRDAENIEHILGPELVRELEAKYDERHA